MGSYVFFVSDQRLETGYREKLWNALGEEFLIAVMERTYEKLGYTVMNFHRDERVNENGIDLLCEKKDEKIAIQAKIKPRQSDIAQFRRFKDGNGDKKCIYVHIRNPTRHFLAFIEYNRGEVEIWDANALHDFLIGNESVDYCCLYFSKHPLIDSLVDVHRSMVESKGATYVCHRFTADELSKLWSAKDNSVKVWVPLYFIYLRWNALLMSKTEKDKKEFGQILEAIEKDLDTTYALCGQKLASSFKDLSATHPDLIGLLWHLVSQRTDWNTYTTYVEYRSHSLEERLAFTQYYWICPVLDASKQTNMLGFYSSMNYLLEHFQYIAKGIESGLDWLFDRILKEETEDQ